MDAGELRERLFRRILLIKPSAFGDVLHTLPVLVKLRRRYPAAIIDWLITPENADAVRYHPALNEVVLFPRRQIGMFGSQRLSWQRWGNLLWQLRKKRYDLVIDLQGLLRSGLLTWWTGAPTRIGFGRPRQGSGAPQDRFARRLRHGWRGSREWAWLAYTHHIPIPTLDVHAIDRYLWVGHLLGFDDAPPELRIYWPLQADAWAADFVRREIGQRPWILIAPSTVWPTKRWPSAHFAAVARQLIALGFAVVIIGSSRDVEVCRQVQALAPQALNLAGKTTISQLAALMDRATVCLTNDSGPMHLAVALGKPLVALFGPTDPVRIGPYGRLHAVVQSNLPCVPCYFRRLEQCPHQHSCMAQISPDLVLQRLRDALAQAPSPCRTWLHNG
ncbi:MAG: glycosyltransferase family 9 protein [Gemmatales bacterium]|nr:glycosyltransferase family 9 protein [Gemmatales bacterium]